MLVLLPLIYDKRALVHYTTGLFNLPDTIVPVVDKIDDSFRLLHQSYNGIFPCLIISVYPFAADGAVRFFCHTNSAHRDTQAFFYDAQKVLLREVRVTNAFMTVVIAFKAA